MPNHEAITRYTVDVDVGDRHSHLCVLDTETGEVVEEARINTTPEAFERRFAGVEPMRVAVEAGNQSLWMSKVIEGCGHEVLVANARKLRLIYADGRKSDRLDAENLARIARLDPRLLSPIEHRGETAQAPRREDSRARGQERQEPGDRRRGEEDRGAAAPAVDDRGGLRNAPQRQPGDGVAGRRRKR